MGEPSSLPSFGNLAKAVAQGSGVAQTADESKDRFLGRLYHKGIDVYSRAAQELSRHNPKSNELHRHILRLNSTADSLRLVTTNFDTLFEESARGLFAMRPESFRAPALPFDLTSLLVSEASRVQLPQFSGQSVFRLAEC